MPCQMPVMSERGAPEAAAVATIALSAPSSSSPACTPEVISMAAAVAASSRPYAVPSTASLTWPITPSRTLPSMPSPRNRA